MEPSSINRPSNMQTAGTVGVQAPKVGRFGLAAKGSLANRVSPLQTEIPTLTEAGSKEGAKELSEGHQVKQVTNGKENPLSNEKVTGAIFSKVHPNEKEDKEIKTRPGEVLIIDQSKKLNRIAVDSKGPKGKEKETNEKEKVNGFETEKIKNKTEVHWGDLHEEMAKGEFLFLTLDSKNKKGELLKPGEHDFKKNPDMVIVGKSGQIFFTSKEQQQRHQDLDNYQFTSNDDSISSQIDNIKKNFSFSNTIVLNQEQVNTLHRINQKRIADKKREAQLQNQQDKENQKPEEDINIDNNQSQPLKSSKINQPIRKTSLQNEKKGIDGFRTLFSFENMKNQKADIEETKEKRAQEKIDEARKAKDSNAEKIDDRVHERLKENLEKDMNEKPAEKNKKVR